MSMGSSDFFRTETVKATDASDWTIARLLEALDQTVSLPAEGEKTDSGSADAGRRSRNYQVIRNELRRRMQANVENFVLLDLAHFYNVDRETGLIDKEEDMPDKYDSVSMAEASLEVLADGDDDIVFIGVSPEDYLRAWNRIA